MERVHLEGSHWHEDNIKMNLQEVGFDVFNKAQARIQ